MSSTTPKITPEDVVEGELVHDDTWQEVEDIARRVERVTEGIPFTRVGQIHDVAVKVQAAAKVGRQVEGIAHDVSDSVQRIGDKLSSLHVLKRRSHPRG